MTVRLLLINPKFGESFWSFKWAINEILPGKRAVNPPLGLATLAALCPAHWEIEIVDENIEPVPLQPRADIIGVCGMGVQFKRQAELLSYYRKHGYFVVAGGSYASLCPELFAPLADAVVSGEAEYIWKRFCADFENGAPRALYRETATVALADSPTPRFDLLKLEKYTTVTLQFSRGCPFRCEFCDIIVMFGRRPRWKSLEQVGRELDALRSRNVRNVFFVDDNFIGHKAAAKDLLRFLRAYQERHDYWFRFGTEASLNLAQDRELLQLFRDANFTWVFIGIESPDEQTLKQTRKTQNLHEDILTAIRRIYSYGVDVLAGFIVGFDNDTLATFDLQYRFIRDSGIQVAMVGLLTALPRTPLYERLDREGRLIAAAESSDNTKVGTNFLPKRMGYDEMVRAYADLYRRLLSDHAIAERVRNKARYLRNPVYHGEYSVGERLVIVARLLMRGILPGGVLRVYHFLRNLPWLAPPKLPIAIVDWIAALAMRDYAARCLAANDAASAAIERRLAAMRRALRSYLERGEAVLTLQRTELSLQLRGLLDRRFYARAARHARRVLAHTPATLTLHVASLDAAERARFARFLGRLARYGDRLKVRTTDALRGLIEIDSSVFHLALDPPPEPRQG